MKLSNHVLLALVGTAAASFLQTEWEMGGCQGKRIAMVVVPLEYDIVAETECC